MFHLDNNSGVSAMPPVGTVQSSAPRWFTEGGGGTPASYPGAAWYNTVQAELLNVLSAYGVAPDKAQLNQLQLAIEEAISQKATAASPLLAAIAALVTSANKMPYFTGKDKVAMTDLTAFARTLLSRSDADSVLSDLGLGTAAKLAAAVATQSSPGYLTIPALIGGVEKQIIVQWGSFAGFTSGDTAVTFPFPFPGNVLHIFTCALATGTGAWAGCNSITKTGFNGNMWSAYNVRQSGSSSYLAIGYSS